MKNGTIREADRCIGLIATLPAPNNDRFLSRMRMPDWLDYDEDSVNFLRDQEAIMEGMM
jgi:hypothetical protein